MEHMTKRLLTQYPDIGQVTSIISEIRSRDLEDTGDSGEATEGDDKYRPAILVLAILYKLQERNDEFFRNGGESLEAEEHSQSLGVLGHYWHQQHDIGKMLREGINKTSSQEDIRKLVEKNKQTMKETLGLEMVKVSVSELCLGDKNALVSSSKQLSTHCPDFTVHLSPGHKAVVLTVLGTRIFPRPSSQDIIMDLACRPQPFLGGQAHGGMVIGHNNLVKFALPCIIEQLSSHPDFSLLIVGYSLGAALAQLFLLDLKHGGLKSSIPDKVRVRGLLYGCPPVYAGPLSVTEDILMVSNHNDGVTGASLRNCHDVVLKSRAIKNLNIRRRDLLKMALNINNGELEEESLKSIMDEEEDDSGEAEDGSESSGKIGTFLKRTKSKVVKMFGDSTYELWDGLQLAVENIPSSKHPQLTYAGEHLLVLKKGKTDEKQRRLSKFCGDQNLKRFSKQIRLKYSMMDHHMPWSYNALFSGIYFQCILKYSSDFCFRCGGER